MSARIARGGGGTAKPRPKAKQPQRGRTSRKPQPGLMDALPLPAETIRRISWVLFLLVLLALAVAVAVAMRLPQTIGTAIGEGIGKAGFEVKRVEINGLERMERLPVYSVALDQPSIDRKSVV